MKKFRWKIIVAITLIALIFIVKVNSNGEFKYISAYLFTDYRQTLKTLGQQYNINFVYEVDDSFIDNALIGPNLNNKAEQISDYELSRYSVLLAELFSTYPEVVIKNEIHTIKLASSLILYGVSYGGTSIESTLYLTSSGSGNGFTDTYITELFHHEFSSILMRNHHFPQDKWSMVNPAKFKYAQNAYEILRAISEDTETTGSDALYKNGFLTKYSMSTLENDVNIYVEAVFTKPNHLKNLINFYPMVKQKFLLLKQFYLSIDPDFSTLFDQILITRQ